MFSLSLSLSLGVEYLWETNSQSIGGMRQGEDLLAIRMGLGKLLLTGFFLIM